MSNIETSAARTVTVGCKLPTGLILRNYAMEEYHEPVMGGGTRKAKRAVQVGEDVRLRGFAVPVLAPTPKGLEVEGGHALTHGVPIEFWKQWHAANKDSPLVKNGIVFAAPERESVVDFAREREKETSGLEPLDMTMKSEAGKEFPRDARVPRKVAKAEGTA